MTDDRTGQSETKSNNLDVRLGVVNVDVMAIPCTIRHRWRGGKAAMKPSIEVGGSDGAMHVS